MSSALRRGVEGKELQAVALIEKMALTAEQSELLVQLLGVVAEIGKESASGKPAGQEEPEAP